MKANELMIGDWVKFPIGNERIIDLPYIMGKGICASFAASATLFPVEVEKLEPTPLTPEILEKNGFVEINDDEKWYKMQLLEENDFVGLEKFEDYGFVFASVVFPNLINHLSINYVHELQHALKLCGIEKTIEL